MDSSLGTRLRVQREQQQVDLTAIAAQTKIKISLLEALESDHVSVWPKGIFGRAYLRDYARAIGLDPEPLVREFYELHPDPIVPVPAQPAPEDEAARAASETPLRRLMSAFGVLPRPKADPAVAAIAHTPIVRSQFDETRKEDVDLASPASHCAVDDEPASTLSLTADGIHPTVAESPDAIAELSMKVAEEEALARASEPPPVHDEAANDARFDADKMMLAAARLCTRLAQATEWRHVDAVLRDAVNVLDAVGTIVWSSDPRGNILQPTFAHGYPASVLSRLPAVGTDEDHALAEAFRSAEVRVVDATPDAKGAVVVPLIAPRGCAGVLALELRRGAERHPSVHAFAAILGAQLVTLVDCATSAEAVSA